MSNTEAEIALRRQLRDLGSYLLDLAEDSDNLTQPNPFTPSAFRFSEGQREPILIDDAPRLRALAAEEYRYRRSRTKQFSEDLFAEPAWDILLDLFIATIGGQRVSVTSACIASACPPTTALRWVTVLEERGLVERAADAADNRRTWLILTTAGLNRMKSYLRAKLSSRIDRKLLNDTLHQDGL